VNVQGDHSPGKPGTIREFQSGQGKVRENEKSLEKSGKLKSVSLYGRTTNDTSTDTEVIYCVILHLLQPQCIKYQILKAQWLPGLLLINVKQQLLTIALNTISMPALLEKSGKSQGIMWSGKWPPWM